VVCIKVLKVQILCKNCDLRISKCLRHFDVLQKKNQALPENGVEELQNASEL